jgi:hypothetical protein
MIRVEVATESWRPTLQATPLRPLLTITSCLILIGIFTSWGGAQALDVMSILGAGALAGGVVLGLDDEANTMLRSSPTGALTRLVHRLVVLVPSWLIAAAALDATDRLLFLERSSLPPASACAALVAAGTAVQVWWSRHRADTAAEGAAVAVMAWALAPLLVPSVWFIDGLARAWQTQAPWVLGLSILLAVGGTIGRSA